ncbi:AAA family ATPase [uncultured Cocleimonas sp.]|uniref:AAA family ATPase n=1 Tax=uncultured Cocleimonas sp. TaxID=1051587 RepID=UPI00261CC310|nr:AAA family ATPase [uncultured Cocleimonas sp.]
MQEYDELAAELRDRANKMAEGEQLWIGLAGGPGSGKSTLSAELQKRLEDLLLVIPLDGYHYYRSELDQMDDPAEAHMRRGAPFTFNSAKFINDLIEAKRSGEGSFSSFDHRIGDPIENDIKLLKTHRIVLVEGNYLLLDADPWSQLRDLVFDEAWYLNVSVDECKRRLMKRHVDVGLSEEQALQRVMTSDGMNAELIAAESPANADRFVQVATLIT